MENDQETDETDGGAKGQSRSGIQSIEVGAPLLDVLARSEGAMSLSVLSAAAGMTASKAHRYLTSFIRVGLIEQDPASGRYNLGPTARGLGLAALRRLDVVRESDRYMQELRDTLDENVVLSVWDEGAPAVVKVEENSKALSIRVRIGARLPLISSSTGLCYAAFLPPAITAPFIEKELAVPGSPAPRIGIVSNDSLERRLEQIRRDGVASAVSGVVNGIAAMCAPVFRYPRTLAGGLTIVGMTGELDTAIPGRIADALRGTAAALSQRLGAEDGDPEPTSNVVPVRRRARG